VKAEPVRELRPVVRVRGRGARDEAHVRALAERLGPGDPDGADGPDGSSPSGAADWTLLVDGGRRVLVRPDGVRLEIDFVAGRTGARQHESGLTRQPLARALGIPRLGRRLGRAPAIVDATGGLGRDAWFAASLGCPVTLVERSPVVHALLESAHARAMATPATAAVAARVTLLAGDAVAALPWLDPARPDVVYLDPMYPSVRRRAAVTKGMQFLHELLGPPDAAEDARLFAAALAAARVQVTVKRPAGAPPLTGDETFDGQRSRIESPGTRYDVYIVRGDAELPVNPGSS